MHQRVQGLDPAIHHFREAGDLGDIANSQSRVTQCLGRAAGGQKFDMVGGQGGGQFKQAGLVGNGQQCPADFHGRAGQEVGGHGEVFQEGSRL